MIRTIQYGKVIFRHARNLFDMDPARSGSRLVADTMGTGTCLQEKKITSITGLTDPIHFWSRISSP